MNKAVARCKKRCLAAPFRRSEGLQDICMRYALNEAGGSSLGWQAGCCMLYASTHVVSNLLYFEHMLAFEHERACKGNVLQFGELRNVVYTSATRCVDQEYFV